MLVRFLIGLSMVALGGFVVSPIAGRIFRGLRDAIYDRAPWLARLPGARSLYGDQMQKETRLVVGSVFLIGGMLVLLGVVDVT